MVKTVIGGIDVQKYITRYSCQCSPVNGNNYFHDINGEYFSDRLGDEVSLNITLEEVPTPLSVQLAEVLEAESVTVDYTTPVPKQDKFIKTSYNAECDDADPDTADCDITDGIIWAALRSRRFGLHQNNLRRNLFMPKVKTITLDGMETAVKFEKGYPYYIITNMGDGELYASGSPGITAYADGVYTILPGMETRISPELSADTVFLLGSGMVQVRAEEIAVPTSFRAAGKGGDSFSGDYNDLANQPSIEGVELNGNKTLADLGITNFDGKYINLSGAPVKCTVINNVSSGWVRFCIIEKAPVSGTMIINVSRQNRTTANNGEAFSFMGVLSYNLCNSRKEASFKILNACGIGSEIPTTRVIVPDNPEWRNIYIDFLTDSIYGLPVNCEMLFDPKIFENSTITCPMAQYPPSIYTVNHKHYMFENKVKEISVDSALSETSENPVQNKVITEALNSKLNSTDIFDWAKADTKPSYTAEEVGADATGSASTALTAANSYTDIAIANLVGTAPEDLNTLEELAQAYKDNKDFAEILSAAITKKQNKLFLGDITTNDVDWNTLTTTGFYQIGVEEKLSDNSTHGLANVYGYGMLIIIPGRYTVYQLYINDNAEVYQRQLYNTWRNWKRIDAGAVTIDSALSATSTNAVQNKVVATAIDVKQDKLTKTVLYNTDSSPSPDWNELREMSIRLVHVGNSLSDSYTHGLGGVYGYGVLSIFSDPSANANIVYQKYVTDVSNQVYIRSLYNSTWRNWKRADAGAVTKETLNLGNVDNTADADKTVKAANNLLCIDLGNMLDNNVGEIKTAIINAIHSVQKNIFFVIRIVMRTDILNNWDNDDFVSSEVSATRPTAFKIPFTKREKGI